MGEIKSHVYHDHEGDHSRSIQRLYVLREIIIAKEFLIEIEKVVKNKKA